MKRNKKEPRCKVGTDLNKSLQFKLLQRSAARDMHCVQPGFSSRPATSARASQLHQCLLYLNRILHSVLFQKEQSSSSHILSAFLHGQESGVLVQSSKRSLRASPSTYRFIYTAYQTSLKHLPAARFPRIILKYNLRWRGDCVPSYLSFLS